MIIIIIIVISSLVIGYLVYELFLKQKGQEIILTTNSPNIRTFNPIITFRPMSTAQSSTAQSSTTFRPTSKVQMSTTIQPTTIQPTTIRSLGLYPFTTHTFTNADATGQYGPTLSAVRSAYSSASWAQDTTNNYLNMTTQGIQLWTVPVTGSYTIDAYGAGTASAGKGGRIKGDFILNKGDIISIVCGQCSIGSTGYAFKNMNWWAEGGGGGTYVCVGSRIKSNILCVAGGGGGSHYPDFNGLRDDGTKFGGWKVSTLSDDAIGGIANSSNGGGSGAGVDGDGNIANSTLLNGTVNAKGFANGSVGGYNTSYTIGIGGFGGGGNGGGDPGGGGGGYIGGACGPNDKGGQGGTSYILSSATNTINAAGGSEYWHGRVIITLL